MGAVWRGGFGGFWAVEGDGVQARVLAGGPPAPPARLARDDVRSATGLAYL